MLLPVMLASILKPCCDLRDQDILIFLNDEEIKELENTPLMGEIFEFRDVRKVYPLELRIIKEWDTEIILSFKNNKYLVNISNFSHPNNKLDTAYQRLVKNEWLGGRSGEYFKFDIMTENYAKKGEFSKDYKFIKSAHENRNRIIEKMIREGL